MLQRALATWHALRSSLWALPLALVCLAAIAATFATSIRLAPGSDPVWWLYSGGTRSAPEFLSNLVSAMITMATLAISITMVVLTLAAQQLGPRLIQSFMSDRITQGSLGLFTATVVYLLLVLRTTYGGDDVPALAVTIGTALVLVCVVTVVVFVHHLARSIIADNVIDRIGRSLDEEIARLLPERRRAAAGPQAEPMSGDPIRLSRGGYVQSINYAALTQFACGAKTVIELHVRAGHYAVARRCIGTIAPSNAAARDITEAVQNAFLLGGERTPIQDLEFSIRQLVEIAVRALSPGINDPFTAIAVLDRLTQSLAHIMERGPAQDVWTDKDGMVRVIAPVSTFDGVVDAAFNQIRQSAESTPAVLIRLAECIIALIETADRDQAATLRRHLKLTVDVGTRGFSEPSDVAQLRERAKTIQAG